VHLADAVGLASYDGRIGVDVVAATRAYRAGMRTFLPRGASDP
jgi:hypothetical protein